jgi:uncharacterized protein (DUF433 family)
MTTATLVDARFTSPILRPREVATLVSMPEPTVRRWTRPIDDRPPMVHEVRTQRRGWPSIPLVGLAEASVLRALRDGGMTMKTAVDAGRYIRDAFNMPYAMASPRLVTDGVEAFILDSDAGELVRIKDNQHAFIDVLQEHLRPLQIGRDGFVESFRVLRLEDVDVDIDPYYSAGRMSFRRNRVPVFAVVDSLMAGESARTVEIDFRLTPTEVQAVERHLPWLAKVA